jgi:hypothetical protein
MMIIDSVEQNSKKGCFMPLKRKSPKGTFGERVRECREENTNYTQEDFTKVLEARYGIIMSADDQDIISKTKQKAPAEWSALF